MELATWTIIGTIRDIVMGKRKEEKKSMLYTVKEVAKRLKCNATSVYTLINLGLLRSLKLGSKKVRDKSLEEFLDKYDGMDIDEVIQKRKAEMAED